jgi:hypothetical protein
MFPVSGPLETVRGAHDGRFSETAFPSKVVLHEPAVTRRVGGRGRNVYRIAGKMRVSYTLGSSPPKILGGGRLVRTLSTRAGHRAAEGAKPAHSVANTIDFVDCLRQIRSLSPLGYAHVFLAFLEKLPQQWRNGAEMRQGREPLHEAPHATTEATRKRGRTMPTHSFYLLSES